ncbi:MAG: hypothetical protein ACI835_004724 [Planctomycetota bacterium]|jgi:hypothetical protein
MQRIGLRLLPAATTIITVVLENLYVTHQFPASGLYVPKRQGMRDVGDHSMGGLIELLETVSQSAPILHIPALL